MKDQLSSSILTKPSEVMEGIINETNDMAVTAQLSFALNNPNAPDTIYIGDEPTLNKLTFSITTNTSVTFDAGVPVDPSGAGSAKGGLIYLDLSPLGITSADFANIKCTAANWDWKAYNDNTLCFAPTKEIKLDSGTGDDINIAIDNLVVQKALSYSENLNVSYYRATPISSGSLPGIGVFKVLLQNAPSGHKDLHTNLACNLSPFNFVTTSIPSADPVSNNFSLVFSPGSTPLEVKAGPNSRFLISFVYADAAPGYGALCTPQEAVKISVKQGINASSWKISSNTSKENPSWTLAPPPGQPIVGSGVKSSLEINIGELVTYFQAGSTMMYVQYENIPGYDDGSYSLLINKLPHVSIDDLTVSPNPSVLKNGSVEVEISWSVQNSEKLTLMPFYEDVTGKTSVKEILSESTEITLVAVGGGSPANEVIKTVKANVLPVINSFKGTPTQIYASDYPHDANFYWDVDTSGDVYLENGAGLKEVVGASGSTKKTIYSPNIWSVVPSNSQEYYKLKRNILVRSFTTENKSYTLPFSPSAMAASPTAPFIATINSTDNKVYILNNITYDNYTDPLITGTKPNDVIFSYDGNFMFVTDESDMNVTVFSVEYKNNEGNYKFVKQVDIVLTSKPQRIAVSNDGKYVFITGINGGKGELSILEASGSSNPYQLSDTLDVGQTPQGLAVNPSGAQVYVANMSDNTISVIGYSPISGKFEAIKTIANVTGSPSDIGLGGSDSTILLVVCKSTNQVIVMSPNDTGNSTRQSLDVGTSPVRISTIPGYAFVTNSGSNNLSLLGTFSGIGNSKVLEKSISVGSSPTAISVSGSDNIVFVANSKGTTMNVLNLINYEAKGTPATVGLAANSTTVSSDGENVLAWYNVTSIMLKSSYDKGIYIYNTESGTVDRKMNNDDIINCLYYPDSSQKMAYVSVKSNNYITILETQQYNSSGQIEIPDGEGGVVRCPQNIAITPDGKTLSTLAVDKNGNYTLLLFQVDISAKKYTKIADLPIFTSTVHSNTILMEMNFDASTIAIVNAYDQHVWVVKESGNGKYVKEPNPLNIDLIAKSMVIDPVGEKLYIVSSLNQATGFNVVNLPDMEISNFPLPASYATVMNLQEMVISPDGSSLYITDADIAGIRVVSTESLRFIQTLAYEQDVRFPSGITITPDGLNMYFTGTNSSNLLWISQIGYSKNHQINSEQKGAGLFSENHLALAADPPYSGIFVRDYVGETTTDHSQGSWTTSPDIICNGTSPITNIGDLTNQDNYNKGLPSTNIQTPLTQNYVYIRGINKGSAPQPATAFLYYVDTTIVLWPQNWKTDGIVSGATGVGNGTPFTAQTADEIVATSPGFLWTPPRTSIHYCLTAWVVNQANASPPELYKIGTVNDMATFILSRPNVAWRNTIEKDATTPTIQDSSLIDGAIYGGLISIGVQLKDLPIGGKIRFSCQGPDPDNTIDYSADIKNPNAGITVQVKWPANYKSTLVFSYDKNGTSPPDGANITPIVGTRSAGADFMSYASKIAPQHIGLFESYESPTHMKECMENKSMVQPIEHVFVIGSVVFKLKS